MFLTLILLFFSKGSVSQNHNNDTKPYFETKLNYSMQSMETEVFSQTHSNYGIELNYRVTELFNGGLFVDYGRYYYSICGNGNPTDTNTTDRQYKYGINAEIHPFAVLFPNLKHIDIYADAKFGMNSYTSSFWENQHKFLFGGSLGINLNISKYFGVFYERCYDNINKKCIFTEFSYNLKTAGFNRFGLNIRFNGPKKWRKE